MSINDWFNHAVASLPNIQKNYLTGLRDGLEGSVSEQRFKAVQIEPLEPDALSKADFVQQPVYLDILGAGRDTTLLPGFLKVREEAAETEYLRALELDAEGQMEEAIEAFREAGFWYEEAREWGMAARSREKMGDLFLSSDQTAQALEVFSNSSGDPLIFKDSNLRARLILKEGMALRKNGSAQDAIDRFSAAVRLAERANYAEVIEAAHCEIKELYLEMGRKDVASEFSFEICSF